MSDVDFTLTPDQRVRVYVGSAVLELASERAAARRVIERLGMEPMMFDLGARPVPPKELYRWYLERSQIYVGIYWQRYGWVGPGEEVSGLEDENLRSSHLLHLLYVKQPAPDREPGLSELLARIRADGMATYKDFSTVDELERLLFDDLKWVLTNMGSKLREISEEQPTARQAAMTLLAIQSGLPVLGPRLVSAVAAADAPVSEPEVTLGGLIQSWLQAGTLAAGGESGRILAWLDANAEIAAWRARALSPTARHVRVYAFG